MLQHEPELKPCIFPINSSNLPLIMMAALQGVNPVALHHMCQIVISRYLMLILITIH